MEEIMRYVSEGVDTAKGGNAYGVYTRIAEYTTGCPLPTKSHYAFGWIIYYAMHQQPDAEIGARKVMLAHYLGLQLEKPHKLHSMILSQAIRLYKDAKNAAYGGTEQAAVRFSIVRFAGLWNLSNLREGDWRRKVLDGKTISSTAEKLITAFVDELEQTKTLPDAAFMAVIDKAVSLYPDSASLLSQRATVHALCGERDEAKAMLRRAILHAPGKFFLWHRLALLFAPDAAPRQHVALLYKALKSPGPDQFKGRVRLDLAKALSIQGMHAHALWELQSVKRTYETNGWNLPKAHHEVTMQIPADTVADNPAPLYAKLEHYADNEVYDVLPALEVTKTYHKNADPQPSKYGKPAVAWRVTDAQGANYWMQPHRYGIPADMPLGTRLELRVHAGKPVKAALIK